MKRYAMVLWIGFLAVTFLCTNRLDGAEADIALESNTGGISFIQVDGRFWLSGMQADVPDIQSSWIENAPALPLWTITIVNPDKKQQALTALSGAAVVRAASEDQLVLEWEDVQPGDLRVVATITRKEKGFEWGLECEIKEPGYALWDIIYPEIGPLKQSENFHGITTNGWGVLMKNVQNWRYMATYPSAARAMPFIGASDGYSGIYLGVHESAGYPFGLFVGKSDTGACVSLGIRHDVEGMGKATQYRLPYAVTTTAFIGDWYECARIYRELGQGTPWGKIPPLAERKDIPKWMLDTDLWYMGACHDEATADPIIAFASYFQVPTSAHVYHWHEIPFDDHYPEYFPAKPGFKNAVEKVQQVGIAVMPYINGRLWDPATDSWTVKKAETACAIDEKGEKYVEVYGSKVPLSPMCPFTEIWKNTVVQLVDRLLNECGVKAVYIDQISAAAAKRCFSEGHNHPVGGGTYWIQGYRDLLQRCRAVQPPDTALTTEENADPWNDQLQAWLLVNTPEKAGEIVPIYPAVYSGRAISFGFQYIHGEDFTYKYPFRLKMARAFVFGSQLGWVGSQVLDPQNREEAEFLKALCLARHASRDALQMGDLLAPVQIEGEGIVSWTIENKTENKTENETKNETFEQPAVLVSAWRTPDDQRKLALANVADEDRTVTLNLDERQIGRNALGKVVLHSSDPETAITLQRNAEGIWQGAVVVPLRSAIVLRIETAD